MTKIRISTNYGDLVVKLYDRIFARDIFTSTKDIENFSKIILNIKEHLSQHAKIIVSQRIPSSAQHLSVLVRDIIPEGTLSDEDTQIIEKTESAETDFFSSKENSLFNWNEKTAVKTIENASLNCAARTFMINEKRRISQDECNRWFDTSKSAYAQFISSKIGSNEFAIAGLKCGMEIENAEYINISFPNFLEILKTITPIKES